MKLLWLNACNEDWNGVSTAFKQVEKMFHNADLCWDYVSITKTEIKSCLHCGKCMKKKECIQEDGVNDILKRSFEYAGVIFSFPAYFGEPDKSMKDFMERLFFSGAANFAYKPAMILVATRKGSGKEAFHKIEDILSLANMMVCINQNFGTIHEENNDMDFIQLNHMCDSFIYLVKAMEEGKKAGLNPPEKIEKVISFVR